MQLRKKLSVMVIFGLGFFTVFATAYKTGSALPKLEYEQVDFSRVIGQVSLWTIVEASIVIIAGSIPTLGWIFKTDSFEKFISWLSLHSRGLTGISTRLSSREGDVGDDSDRIQLRGAHAIGKEKQDGSVALQSIDRIERQAFS
ncbi:MAG: hypothetical protein Q9166_007605 [cf. Caloplaca sp. 2 TL-2023]